MALTTNNYWQQESNIFVLVWNIVTITTNAEVGSIAFKSFFSQIFFSPKICANLWYWSNLASEFRPRFNFITSSKHQQQNTDQTPASTLCSKSEQKLNFMTKPQLPNLQQTLANMQHATVLQPQQVLSWHLHTPWSLKSSLLNSSQSESVSDKSKQWSD